MTKIIHGSNLIPEGLEFGEVRIQDSQDISDLDPIAVVAFSGEKVMFSQGSGEVAINQNGVILNGMPISCAFLYCEINAFPILIKAINDARMGDKIVTAFTVPRLAISQFLNDDRKIGEVIGTLETYTIYAFQGSAFETVINNFKQNIKSVSSFTRPTNLNGYTPRNKKLLTYPYCYIGVNTPNSSSKIYRFEDFANGSANFNVMSEINPNPTVLFIPVNYRNNETYSMQDLFALNGYPTLATISDYFNTWLAQNSNIVSLQMQQEQYNYEMNAIKGGFGMASDMVNMATGNVGAVGGFFGNVFNLLQADKNHEFYIKQQMAQIEKQALLPNNVSLSSSNATMIGYDLIDNAIFNLYTIRSQFAERIDKYFDMFGYLTNLRKIPNLKNRPNWNYVKTIDINIISGMPQEDLQILKNIYNQGVTIWHNPETFGDYSQNNR